MALTLKVPYSVEDEARLAVAGLRGGDSASVGAGAAQSDHAHTVSTAPVGDRDAQPSARRQSAAGGVPGISGAKEKLDELFLQWLALPDTADLFNELIANIKNGQPLAVPPHTSLVASLLHRGPLGSAASAGSGSSSPLRGKNSPPPRSPSRAAQAALAGPATNLQFSFSADPSDDASKSMSHQVSSPLSPPPAARTSVSSPAGGDASPQAASPAGSSTVALSAASPSTPPRPPQGGATKPVSPPPPGAVTTPGATTPGTAHTIPTFYVPGAGGRGRGKPMRGEELPSKLNLVVEVFRAAHEGRAAELVSPPAAVPPNADGSEPTETAAGVTVLTSDANIALRVEQFPAVAKTLCGFPSFFAAPLFRRVKKLYMAEGNAEKAERKSKAEASAKAGTEGKDGGESDSDSEEDKGQVPLRVFLQYWRDEMEKYDHVDRFFRLTKQPDSQFIVKSDLLPLMEELLAFHPGLAFLESTPEFQEKYARTVIARIFYMLDPLNRGVITPRALRKSNLIGAFQHVDMEEDINLVNEYFSYEHFYVLYCKFWELDTDHDFLLSRDDLDALGNHSLTKPVLDRVFSQAGRPFECTEPGKMGYEDFVCFLMSEEDKTHPISIGYWFRLIDLDGDGVIRPDEMRHFYADQMQRMEDMNCEVVPFEDVLCQMSDLLQPDVEGEFRMKDFLHPTRARLTGVFFSILSNLSKFTAFEQRDPFVVKQQQEPGFTAWDRYAQIEYARLAMEEDATEDGMSLDQIEEVGGVGAWDDDDVSSPL